MTTAVQSPTTLTSAAGNIGIIADQGDVHMTGTQRSAGMATPGENGNIYVKAGHDIIVDAKTTEEIHEDSSFGFSGLGVSSTSTEYNNFAIALTSFQGSNVMMHAGVISSSPVVME